MHRFYLPPDQCSDTILRLDGREGHHASRVLRVRAGESVVVLDGKGKTYHADVTDVAKSTVELAVRRIEKSPAPACAITLVQAIPKAKLLDSIIQKATELGATRVIPLLSERVVTQIDESNADSKSEHWRTVAIEAIKQCGSPWLPEVEPALRPSELLARNESSDLFLIASLQPGSRHAGVLFREFRDRERREPGTISIWVGPEGDFTPREVETAISAGARPITLGPLVLRCETAATYCLSLLNYEIQSCQA